MDEISLLRTELEEVAKDTVQEQQKQAGKHHPQKVSPMVPEYKISQIRSINNTLDPIFSILAKFTLIRAVHLNMLESSQTS